MNTELCAACGCGIVNLRTPAGRAIRHGTKLYCAECAALILTPEEMAELSNPAASPPPLRRGAAAENFVEEIPEAVGAPPPLKPSGSGVRAPSRLETASVGKRAGSSALNRRVSTAVGRRDSRVIEARESARGGKGENKRARSREKNNQMLYVILGVVGLGLCVILFVVLRGSGKLEKKKSAVAAQEDSDKTSSSEYARQAEDAMGKNDRTKAASFYGKAAAKAEKEGNPYQAKIYNMKIVDLEKSSTINSVGGK